MGSFSLVHWLIVLAVALLLFGGRLPGLGKALGEGIRNFKSGLGGEDENAQGDTQGQQASQKQISGGAERSQVGQDSTRHRNG